MSGKSRLREFERGIEDRYLERILTLLESEPPHKVRAAFSKAGQDYDRARGDPETLRDFDIFGLLHELNRGEYFPGVCLRFGLARDLLDLGVLGYTILSCRDLGTAMQVIVKYHRLTSDAYQVTLTAVDELTVIRQWIKPKHAQRRVVIDEEHVTGLWKVLQYLSPNTFDEAAVQICFAHAEPSYGDLYRELLPCDLSFDNTETAIAFPTTWLEQPIQTADDIVEQVCESQCDLVLNELNPANRLVDDLRRLILAMPASRTPKLEDCARRMLMSTRTLERRLEAGGTSFRSVSNEVRMQLAAEYLAFGYMANKQIARMLNYSQPSTFYRAFKKWHGVTTSEYRENLGLLG